MCISPETPGNLAAMRAFSVAATPPKRDSGQPSGGGTQGHVLGFDNRPRVNGIGAKIDQDNVIPLFTSQRCRASLARTLQRKSRPKHLSMKICARRWSSYVRGIFDPQTDTVVIVGEQFHCPTSCGRGGSVKLRSC